MGATPHFLRAFLGGPIFSAGAIFNKPKPLVARFELVFIFGWWVESGWVLAGYDGIASGRNKLLLILLPGL